MAVLESSILVPEENHNNKNNNNNNNKNAPKSTAAAAAAASSAALVRSPPRNHRRRRSILILSSSSSSSSSTKNEPQQLAFSSSSSSTSTRRNQQQRNQQQPNQQQQQQQQQPNQQQQRVLLLLVYRRTLLALALGCFLGLQLSLLYYHQHQHSSSPPPMSSSSEPIILTSFRELPMSLRLRQRQRNETTPQQLRPTPTAPTASNVSSSSSFWSFSKQTQDTKTTPITITTTDTDTNDERMKNVTTSRSSRSRVPLECQGGREPLWYILQQAGVENAAGYCTGMLYHPTTTTTTTTITTTTRGGGSRFQTYNRVPQPADGGGGGGGSGGGRRPAMMKGSIFRPTFPGTSLTFQRLPLWNETTRIYGSEPVILRFCEPFRNRNNNNTSHGPETVPFLVPRIAGMYNSGTNALKKLFLLNFRQVQDNRFLVNATHPNASWSLPWLFDHELNLDSLKHNPASQNRDPTPQIPFLRVLITRDPFRWILSTCRQMYSIKWKRRAVLANPHNHHNPLTNLPTCTDRFPPETPFLTFQFPYAVNPGFKENASTTYPSLPDMWTTWHQEHLDLAQRKNGSIPTIVVRFEDILFHAPKVMQAIAECAGMDMMGPWDEENQRHKIIHHLERSKEHGGNRQDGFAVQVAKVASPEGRTLGFTDRFYNYTTQVALDPKLLQLFQYSVPPATNLKKSTTTTTTIPKQQPPPGTTTRTLARSRLLAGSRHQQEQQLTAPPPLAVPKRQPSQPLLSSFSERRAQLARYRLFQVQQQTNFQGSLQALEENKKKK